MISFTPGRNREFFGNRGGVHFGKTSGQFYGGAGNANLRGGFNPGKTSGMYYGGSTSAPGAGLAAPLSPPSQGGPRLGGPLPPYSGVPADSQPMADPSVNADPQMMGQGSPDMGGPMRPRRFGGRSLLSRLGY